MIFFICEIIIFTAVIIDVLITYTLYPFMPQKKRNVIASIVYFVAYILATILSIISIEFYVITIRILIIMIVILPCMGSLSEIIDMKNDEPEHKNKVFYNIILYIILLIIQIFILMIYMKFH